MKITDNSNIKLPITGKFATPTKIIHSIGVIINFV